MLNFQKDTKKGYVVLILIFILFLIVCNVVQLMFINQTFENSDYLKKEIIKIEATIKKYESDNKLIIEKINKNLNELLYL